MSLQRCSVYILILPRRIKRFLNAWFDNEYAGYELWDISSLVYLVKKWPWSWKNLKINPLIQKTKATEVFTQELSLNSRKAWHLHSIQNRFLKEERLEWTIMVIKFSSLVSYAVMHFMTLEGSCLEWVEFSNPSTLKYGTLPGVVLPDAYIVVGIESCPPCLMSDMFVPVSCWYAGLLFSRFSNCQSSIVLHWKI